MGKKIRLGNCGACEGFVLVDIAGDTVAPLLEECRRCGVPIDGDSVVDVPLLEATTEDGDVVCDDCGERWADGAFDGMIDELGGCPDCKPVVYGSLPADG